MTIISSWVDLMVIRVMMRIHNFTGIFFTTAKEEQFLSNFASNWRKLLTNSFFQRNFCHYGIGPSRRTLPWRSLRSAIASSFLFYSVFLCGKGR